MLRDFHVTVPNMALELALAKILGIHRDSFRFCTIPEIALELLKYWPHVSHVIHAWGEIAHRRRLGNNGYPEIHADNPMGIVSGETWFTMKKSAFAFRKCLAGHTCHEGTKITSLGELDAMVRHYANDTGLPLTNFLPRVFAPWSRLVPLKVSTMFDADYIVTSSIRKTIRGDRSTINQRIYEISFPGLWSRIESKCDVAYNRHEIPSSAVVAENED